MKTRKGMMLVLGTGLLCMPLIFILPKVLAIFIFQGSCLKEVIGLGVYVKGPFKRKEGVFFKDDLFARRINYPQDAGFAKKVVGVAGDRIKVQGMRVQVYDGKELIWEAVAYKKKNHLPIEETQIPLSHYFLAGTSSNSIDSRYQTLGLVSEEKIEGKWWGWWVA